MSAQNCLVYCFPLGLFLASGHFFSLVCRSALNQKLWESSAVPHELTFRAASFCLVHCHAITSCLGLSLHFSNTGFCLFPFLALLPGNCILAISRSNICFVLRLWTLLKYFLKVHLEYKSKFGNPGSFLDKGFWMLWNWLLGLGSLTSFWLSLV